MNVSPPLNAIAACTHANPYPYYAQLVEHSPFFYDAELGMWVATSAAAVEAILNSDICRVRPASEPVPIALFGSPAADIFRCLIRMNDGAGHCPFNKAIGAALNSIDTAHIDERATYWAAELISAADGRSYGHDSFGWINNYSFGLSVYVIGDLFGLRRQQLADASRWVQDFVRCVFPASTPHQVEQGKLAAGQLLGLFNGACRSTPTGLLAQLFQAASRVGQTNDSIIIANAIGFLSQAYEATAGLIQNSLLVLASNLSARHAVVASPHLLPNLILEVLRYDPPSHNTRRFIARDSDILDRNLKQGDVVLVALAAANRDPAVNARPTEFDLLRADRKFFTFGRGAHACPGYDFATTIAQAGIRSLMAADLNVARLTRFTYRASGNTRIPLFE